ncbi:endospore germination permease [Thermoactinomyces sp. DSM 45892]|uniref:endospore germination permease n=1 Tax=Thermoactinomyces sp. DSM 45892 TaxID=1882753 RepID=UPI00089B1B65|nr:endospore germination permease [Thermoactinomyces sp. DSM 45892]SDY78342.1 spore germination protein (amino acid permease) [Thermoactinomyces sp. DSM 45892]
MDRTNSISIIHISMIGMVAIGFKSHVLVIPPLIQAAGRDSWMTPIVILIVALLWAPLLLYINKKTQDQNQSLMLWLRDHIGKIPTYIISCLILLECTAIVSFALNDTIVWTSISYLPSTPNYFITVILASTSFYLALKGLRTLAIVNFVLIFAIVLFGFFAGISNLQVKNYSLLLPFLENGIKPVIHGSIYPASGIVEMVIFILLQHKIKKPLKYKHLAWNMLILSSLALGPLVGAIVEFGPREAGRQRYPAFEEWGLVQLSEFVGHLDFLSIYQWLSGAFIRISLYLIIIGEIFPLQKETTRKYIMLGIISLSTILVCIGASDTIFYKWEKILFLPLTAYIFSSISFILAICVWFGSKKSKKKANKAQG